MKRASILPEGSEVIAADETVLWEGQPNAASFARHVLHLRAVIGYFMVLVAAQLAFAHGSGFRAGDALVSAAWLLLPGIGAALVIYASAYIYKMTTRYTITDRRVILEIGVALPIALTLPLGKIVAADVRLNADGTGDIPLRLGAQKIAYLLLWPYARPWNFSNPQPMLRAVPDARRVADILARALRTASPEGRAVTLSPVEHAPHGAAGVATA